MKLNGETFKERPFNIEETKKLPNSPAQSPTERCPSVVINQTNKIKINEPVKIIFQLFQENKHKERLLFQKLNLLPKLLS